MTLQSGVGLEKNVQAQGILKDEHLPAWPLASLAAHDHSRHATDISNRELVHASLYAGPLSQAEARPQLRLKAKLCVCPGLKLDLYICIHIYVNVQYTYVYIPDVDPASLTLENQNSFISALLNWNDPGELYHQAKASWQSQKFAPWALSMHMTPQDHQKQPQKNHPKKKNMKLHEFPKPTNQNVQC